MFDSLFELNNKQIEFFAGGLRALGTRIFLTALANPESTLMLSVVTWFTLEMFAMWFLSHVD